MTEAQQKLLIILAASRKLQANQRKAIAASLDYICSLKCDLAHKNELLDRLAIGIAKEETR